MLAKLNSLQDLDISEGRIVTIRQSTSGSKNSAESAGPIVDLKGSVVFPTFIDMHTHIGLAAHL